MKSRFARKSVLFACLMAFIFALAVLPVVNAQETTGGIKGYVKDKTGGTVAGAQV